MQLDEAEGELTAMTKNRDELQAVVAELEEKVCIRLLVTTNCLQDNHHYLWLHAVWQLCRHF